MIYIINKMENIILDSYRFIKISLNIYLFIRFTREFPLSIY